MLPKKFLKENIFYYFDEVEYYKINKGFVKANLEELSKMFDDAYQLGYRQALSNMEDSISKCYWKSRGEKKNATK